MTGYVSVIFSEVAEGGMAAAAAGRHGCPGKGRCCSELWMAAGWVGLRMVGWTR